MRKLKILMIWCLVLSLMLSVGMTSVGLAEGEQEIVQEIDQESEDVKRLHEITELRESSSKTYLLEDGTYQFVGHAEDIHYIDESGEYADINNAISNSAKDGYVYANTANSWYAHFGDSIDQKGAVVMEKDEYSISFGIAESANATSVQKSSSALSKSDSEFDEYLSEDSRTVVYKDVYDNVDIAYTVRTGGLKEDIILRDNSAPNTFEFDIETSGLTIAQREGLTCFVDSKGEEVFRLAPMYMEDANEKFSDKVSFSIEEQEGGYSLTVTADEDFLSAKDTVYPVVIDPSVMVTGIDDTHDTCIDQEYPTSYYYSSENLWTGGDYGTNAMRTFIRFDLPANIPDTNVTSAYLRIKKRAYETPGIKAYRVTTDWTPSSVNWNNNPSYTTSYQSTTAYNDSGDWYRMYTTTLVKWWLNGTYNNYGYILKEPTETDEDQKTKFYSSDAPSPNKPELIIVYTAEYPLVTKSARIYYDSSCTYSSAVLTSYYNNATDPFEDDFNIRFSVSSIGQSATLNGSSCTLGISYVCTSTDCGVLTSCNSVHHKGAKRLNGLLTSASYYTYRLVGHKLCYYDGSHGSPIGIGERPGKNAITSTLTSSDITRSIQHELTHNLGASHSTCNTSQKCVLTDYIDFWCENCKASINDNR